MERTLTYTEAIREAADQEMERDEAVVMMGLGITDPKAILGTTRGLIQKYGSQRVIETPLSEDGMTGVAIGMALAGLRPIHVHIRMDFLMLAMNQLVNMAAKAHYMYGGQVRVPLVVRGIIGKSWGQGAQHSQALYSFFMHVPGLKVVAPTTPYDVKGCLIHAIRDNNPVLFIEHRILHFEKGPVPETLYTVAPGKARVVTRGDDITIVGVSYMNIECLRAERYLRDAGISAEVIDPVWLAPFDFATIVESVSRTGRLLVVDNDWLSCGASAEIVTQVVEGLQGEREVKVHRMGFAASTCAPSPTLENLFYPNPSTIASEAYAMVRGSERSWVPNQTIDVRSVEFRGPF